MASRCGGGTPDVQARSKEGFCGHRLWEPGMGGALAPQGVWHRESSDPSKEAASPGGHALDMQSLAPQD